MGELVENSRKVSFCGDLNEDKNGWVDGDLKCCSFRELVKKWQQMIAVLYWWFRRIRQMVFQQGEMWGNEWC